MEGVCFVCVCADGHCLVSCFSSTIKPYDSAFAPFGPVSYVKIPPGKGCGFVSYVHRQSAEQAIAQLNGAIIGANRIRLSWGRNSAVGTTMQQGGAANMMPMGMGMTGGSMGGYRQHGHPAPASLHMQHAQQQHQMYYGNGGAQWAEEGAMAYGQAIAASGVQQSHHAPPSLQQHQQQPSRVVAMEYGHPASSSTGFAQPTPTSASVSPFAHPFFGAGLPSASSTTASAASSRALLPPGTKSAFSSVAPSTAASTLGRSTSSSPLPLASPEKLITPSSSPFDSRSTAGSPDSRSAPTSLEGGDSIWRTDASLFSMEMSFAPLMKHQAYTSASATVAKPTAAKRDEGDKPSGEKQDQASVDRADDDKKQREQTYLHDDHLIDALVDGLNATAFE